ncbi:MAG: hypothetical protein IPM57_03475 [Oligoflexia bacterium]|nr:hypothetical protein [Oligoflexia bacterium]
MGNSGQALTEFIILTAIFMALLAGIATKLPVTFKSATPYLGGQVEARLQTGVGFARTPGQTSWSEPIRPKGGLRD